MPEENNPIDLPRTLDLLEDPMLNPLARGQYYKAFITALESNVEMSPLMVDRLLAVCVQDLENDKKSIIHVLKIIHSILKRIKAGGCSVLINLLPSILALFNIIKTTALMSKVETMQTLCFEILKSYPNETLIEIATLHTSEVVEVLNLYCHLQIPLEVRVLPCGLIHKLLKILPPEKKAKFVRENLSIWFSKVIPTTILSVSHLDLARNKTLNLKSLETLESLTEELLPIDYTENPQWLEMLECIHSPSKYPAMMREMLNSNSNKWHRLWIIFIKLLKHQITKTTFTQASPINSMLPVVEQAFKMDVTNRCRAFQCWDILIDNFRTETNEAYIVKRLKLLIIPLKSNNAKVEETALAKLKTWWHLIQSYQTKLDKFVDKVLISFLHFSFGRHIGMSPKSSLVPGLLSNSTKRKSVEALIELAGQLSCTGCVDVPKLNKRILSISVLIDHWSDWVHSLKMAINIFNEDVGLTIEQLECLWKSFVMIIAEMPDNNIRKDLFNELLSILENFQKEPEPNGNVAKTVFHLLTSLFSDNKIQVLFKPRDEQGPIYKIISLLISAGLNIFYIRGDTSYIIGRLKPLSKYLLDKRNLVPWLLNYQSQQNISYLLTAIAESVYETNYEDVGELFDFMLWPLKSTNFFTNVEYSTQAWLTFVNYMYSKMKANMKDKLRSAIGRDITHSNIQLKLRVCIAILNIELTNDTVAGVTKNVELLILITSKIDDYKYLKDNLTTLTDAINNIVNILKNDAYPALFKNTVTLIKNVLKFMNLILEGPNASDDGNKAAYERLLNNLGVLIDNNTQTPLTTVIFEELLGCSINLHKRPSIKSSVINVMKAYIKNSKDTDSSIVKKIKAAVVNLESKIDSDKEDNQQASDDKFAAPNTKTVTKKAKKKETTIVNTVVENGEEYEVIKSNWKFNPRKLTENQKEKLQRKREDIPALYQDLSQSQDEFKLSAWKPDSQDTSSTNSRSTTNSKSGSTVNVSEILKNIPSSDVVPKIIENIFSEKKDADVTVEAKPVNETTIKLKQINNKDPKSPRMALKDRVFRNVRNLIEKSSVQKDTRDLSESLIQVENMPKTPVSKSIDNTNLVNSAPPNLGAERPARLKRKPRKFDDVQIFSLKKSRRSSSLNDSQSDSPTDCPSSNESTHDRSPLPKTMEVATPLGEKPNAESKEKLENCVLTINDAKDVITENVITVATIHENIEPVNIAKINQEVTPQQLLEKTDDLGTKSLASHSSGVPEIISALKENQQITSDEDIKINPSNLSESPEKDITIECTLQESVNKTNTTIGDIPEDQLPSTKCVEETPNEANDNKSNDDTFVTVKGNTKSVRTPKQTKRHDVIEPRSGKRNSARKSRIEKELAIDTVEGHPFLKIQTEKRITRKNLNNPTNNSRRKSLTDKLNKSKVDSKTPVKMQGNSLKKKELSTDIGNASVTICESQEKCSDISIDLPNSEDVIESSQDSTFSTISVKTSKPALKKLTLVLQKSTVPSALPDTEKAHDSLSFDETMDIDNKDDTELPQNKTAEINKTCLDSTENMDTQPVDNRVIEVDQHSSDVIIINDDDEPIVISAESQEIATADTQPINPSLESQEIAEAGTQPITVSSETQEIAEADTQHSNITSEAQAIVEVDTQATPTDLNEISLKKQTKPIINMEDGEIQISNTISNTTENDITATINTSMDISSKPDDENTASSPFKDEAQRKKDFLDNTFEISPIKTMSPVRGKKSPSPETSSDYVLIKLSSPVQSNGEPFEKCDSPEIFSEDKVSPDKRDLSPPREEGIVNNTSPSSSLSLKKNRPQVRSGGRAAQMLGLCVPDRLQTIKNTERSEPEETKKNSPCSTPARRNLRILYNSVGADSIDISEENEDSENFLKFKRVLPTSDCSPSGPILKRKLAEITDDATISPASKRKRVSFHDPPVSTTITVQKYIEPCGVRSPQNSALKRQERQNLRSQTILSKSPKRLDNVFKLDTVLTKAVESFTEAEQCSTDITQSMSLDETPVVEIVKNSDLNNVDPICVELVDCNDPIDGIAAELSSPTMKTMFLKELEGKISTVGDLAKMTELEVNRLCIKAPKVKVAKKVLSDYASKRVVTKEIEPMDTIEIVDDEICPETNTIDKVDIEVQTSNIATNNVDIQTACVPMTVSGMQTDEKIVVHISAQTTESGAKATKEIISTCVAERPDFIESLCEHLDESSKKRIAEKLPANTLSNIFMKNVTSANSRTVITQILQKQNRSSSSKAQSGNDLLFLQDYLCDRFDNKDLILFCSQMLAKIHNKIYRVPS